MVAPVDVDGSTIFAARSGRALHEFAYTDVQQAYQSNDLALVAAHLIREPVSMAYDQARRLLHVVMADGAMATLTLFRAEQVTAWTRQDTAGLFRGVAEVDGRVFCAVERTFEGAATLRLERLDPDLALDAALTGSDAAPRSTWSGLAHIEGQEVGVLADGVPRAAVTVQAGAATLADGEARAVQIGLRFAHEVEPLPPELLGPGGTRAAPIRLVSASFRLLATGALSVDLGRGAKPVPFRRFDRPVLDAPPVPFTGDLRLAALGWRRDASAPLWRIEGDAPLPFTLLSATTETRTND